MGSDTGLSLSLQQRLKQGLSPMQLQYGMMLEMTGPEVEEAVRLALDENPALGISDEGTTHSGDEDNDGSGESAEQMQLADYASEEDIPSYKTDINNSSPDSNELRGHDMAAEDNESLLDYIERQLGELHLTPTERIITQYIAGSLDDNGYMTRSTTALAGDIALTLGIDVDREEIKKSLDIIRSLDPAGIGANDLRDCLLLQLRRIKGNNEAVKTAITIVADYFDLFSKMHYDRLKSQLNITEKELKEAINVIKSLNPKPGGVISARDARNITPDFIVDTEGGIITLSLVNNIPDLCIEQSFKSADTDLEHNNRNSRTTTAYEFINSKRREAENFINLLQMRQETLFNVMSGIVKIQREFFLTDDETTLRPMILKDIADITGYDLSVISRSTAGKYVATGGRIYPLKFFFNERPKAEDNNVSVHKIMDALRSVIAAEDKRRPMSDEAITAEMQKQGFDIARRTVAKYRERLGVPVARLRRKL